jgi:hypothetical protein
MNAPTRTAEGTALSTATDVLPRMAPTGRDLVLHAENLNAMVTVAKMMSQSKQAVPKHLRGNEGACMAVTMQAMRWNMDPFALALKTYTTDAESPLAYEGQAIIAALNNSPLLATRLSFRWDGAWERIVGRFKEVESRKKDQNGNPILDAKGQPKKYIVPDWDFNKDEDGLSVTVSATLQGESQPRELTLLMKQARVRNSPLWTEDPKQQLAYLAGRRWGRLHAPDVIMGVYTPDELQEFERVKDMGPADVVEPKVDDQLLKRGQEAAAKGRAAYQEFWKGCTHMDRAMLSEKSDWHEKLKAVAAEADDKRTVNVAATPAATNAPKDQPGTSAASAPAAETSQPAGPATGSAQADGFKATYAAVLDKMLAAAQKKDQDALDIAADWIGEIPDPEQRKELSAKYDELTAEIAGGMQQ